MPYEKFDVSRLERLNDTARFEYLDPAVIWSAAGVDDAGVIVEIGAGTGLFSEHCRACSRVTRAACNSRREALRVTFASPSSLAARLSSI